MPRTATTVAATIVLTAIVALVGCTPNPSAREPSGAAAAPTAAPATPTTAPTPPVGTTLVDIPAAGISLAIPDGWQQVTGSELTDPSLRADLAATYPGAGSLFEVTDGWW